jgi:hypothetical protein
MSFQQMNNQTWGPEDGALLQNLRTSAGIDAFVFARTNTISAAQLQELESGEGRSFYNELIKRNTGIKLLKKLGYEYPVNAEQVTPPALESMPAVFALETEALAQTDSIASPISSSDIYKKSSPHPFFKHPLLVTAGLLSMGFLGFLGIQYQGQTQREIPTVLQSESGQTTTPASAAQTTESPPSLVITSGTETLPQTASLPTAESNAHFASDRAQLASIACDDKHRKYSASHTPSNPLKPGSYIYIEAKADSALCVLDSDNKLSLLSLKAGMNQTVNGLAPFLVHTSNWQGLQIFFQGRLVRTDLGDSAHLLLQSLPF